MASPKNSTSQPDIATTTSLPENPNPISTIVRTAYYPQDSTITSVIPNPTSVNFGAHTYHSSSSFSPFYSSTSLPHFSSHIQIPHFTQPPPPTSAQTTFPHAIPISTFVPPYIPSPSSFPNFPSHPPLAGFPYSFTSALHHSP
ncbi:hypothetical protein QN277_010514 [Acacia crassicarpa]|uniref:Uncharacterized protein n=1 Tax=Acacia crassicarpa TaxID=499986 RepID=A0AAE1IMZ4_9FABA|nr:hypothetical protein QN277_010514 [Acacia crassicarpa]